MIFRLQESAGKFVVIFSCSKITAQICPFIINLVINECMRNIVIMNGEAVNEYMGRVDSVCAGMP